MARPPAPPPMPAAPPPGPAGGAPPPPPPGGDDTGDSGDQVVLTVTMGADGSFTLYAGDEPDGDTGDMSDDDTDAMGPGGGGAADGQHAASVGDALKIAMGILNTASQGSGGQSPEQQFVAGFGGPGAGAGGPPPPGGM